MRTKFGMGQAEDGVLGLRQRLRLWTLGFRYGIGCERAGSWGIRCFDPSLAPSSAGIPNMWKFIIEEVATREAKTQGCSDVRGAGRHFPLTASTHVPFQVHDLAKPRLLSRTCPDAGSDPYITERGNRGAAAGQ